MIGPHQRQGPSSIRSRSTQPSRLLRHKQQRNSYISGFPCCRDPWHKLEMPRCHLRSPRSTLFYNLNGNGKLVVRFDGPLKREIPTTLHVKVLYFRIIQDSMVIQESSAFKLPCNKNLFCHRKPMKRTICNGKQSLLPKPSIKDILATFRKFAASGPRLFLTTDLGVLLLKTRMAASTKVSSGKGCSNKLD